jgi:hypothetical protein
MKRIEIQGDGKLSKYGALKAAQGERYQVFISHAGEQKTNIVDYLYEYFGTHYPAVKVFLDRVGLAKGGNNMRDMHSALQDSFVGVCTCLSHPLCCWHPWCRRCRQGHMRVEHQHGYILLCRTPVPSGRQCQ